MVRSVCMCLRRASSVIILRLLSKTISHGTDYSLRAVFRMWFLIDLVFHRGGFYREHFYGWVNIYDTLSVGFS